MSKVILIILAILLPPLAVYLKTKSANESNSWFRITTPRIARHFCSVTHQSSFNFNRMYRI